MTQNSKALRGKSSADTSTLINEVNFEFAKTMNGIIFSKHCAEKNNNLITGKLELPPPKPQNPKTPGICDSNYNLLFKLSMNNSF